VARFSVVPAAYLLPLRGEGRSLEVLLQLRGAGTSYMAGHWASAAAGHVEYGESVLAAAVREATEELGIGVAEVDLEPLCAMHRTLAGVSDTVEQRVDFFVTTRNWTGDPAILEPAKCQELRWCSLHRLPDPVVPHERHLLGLLAEGAVPPVVAYGF